MKKTVAVIALLACASAWAFGTLTSQESKGNYKFCTYSNGVTIKISSLELCPTTIN